LNIIICDHELNLLIKILLLKKIVTSPNKTLVFKKIRIIHFMFIITYTWNTIISNKIFHVWKIIFKFHFFEDVQYVSLLTFLQE